MINMLRHITFKHVMRHLLWLTFSLSLLTFTLGISWQLSKSANFFYGFWYQSLQIDSTIKKNVIKNKRKIKQENWLLFTKKIKIYLPCVPRKATCSFCPS